MVVSAVSEWPSGRLSEGILSEVPISWVFFPSASHRKIPTWEAKKQQLRDMTAPDSADAVREDSLIDFLLELITSVFGTIGSFRNPRHPVILSENDWGVQSRPQHSIGVPLPCSGVEWIPRGIEFLKTKSLKASALGMPNTDLGLVFFLPLG